MSLVEDKIQTEKEILNVEDILANFFLKKIDMKGSKSESDNKYKKKSKHKKHKSKKHKHKSDRRSDSSERRNSNSLSIGCTSSSEEKDIKRLKKIKKLDVKDPSKFNSFLPVPPSTQNALPSNENLQQNSNNLLSEIDIPYGPSLELLLTGTETIKANAESKKQSVLSPDQSNESSSHHKSSISACDYADPKLSNESVSTSKESEAQKLIENTRMECKEENIPNDVEILSNKLLNASKQIEDVTELRGPNIDSIVKQESNAKKEKKCREKSRSKSRSRSRPRKRSRSRSCTSQSKSKKRSNSKSRKLSNSRSGKRSNSRSRKRSDSGSRKRSDSGSRKRSDSRSRKRSKSRSRKRSDSGSRKRSNSRSRKHSDSGSRKRSNSRSRKRSDSGPRKCSDSRSRKRSDSRSRKRSDSRSRKRSKSRSRKRSKSRSRSKYRSRKERSYSRDHSKSRHSSQTRRSRSRNRSKKSRSRSPSSRRRRRSRSRSYSKDNARSKRDTKHRSRSIGRRCRSRSRSKERGSPRSRRESSYSDNSNRKRKSSSERESRSKQKSRSKSKEKYSSSKSCKIDQAKIREIAEKNVLNMIQQGTLPEGISIEHFKKKELVSIKAGGKSVQELTDFCAKLSKRENEVNDDTHNANDVSNLEGDNDFIHHPFKLKEQSVIKLNIKNAVQIPIKTHAEKFAETAKLSSQFPVSSGNEHKHKELEWIPVVPEEKKSDSKLNEVKSVVPVESAPSAVKLVVPKAIESPTLTTAPMPISSDIPSIPLPSTPMQPLPPPPPPPLPPSIPPLPTPPAPPFQLLAPTLAFQASEVQTPCTNSIALQSVSYPSLPLSNSLPVPTCSSSQIFSTETGRSFFNNQTASASTSQIDFASVFSKKFQAEQKLQADPNNVEALKAIQEAEAALQEWVNSCRVPGMFYGSTHVKPLPRDQLGGLKDYRVKRDAFTRAAPVTEGKGMSLLKKMGWNPGEGLGKNKEGSLVPLLLDIKMDKKGLVSEGESGKNNITNAVKELQGKHPVSALMELCSKRKWKPPLYNIIKDTGPPHKKQFLFKVEVNGVDYQPVMPSSNKKVAKADAAIVCLQALKVFPS